MWSLIQTQPNRSAAETRSARPTSRVQTDDARPYGVPFAHAIASRLVAEALHGDHRTEDLALDQLVVLLQSREHRRLEEEPGPRWRDAAGHDLGVPRGSLEQPFDARALARRVERAERRLHGERVTQHVAPGLLGEPGHDVVVDLRSEASTRVAAVQSCPAL